MAVNREVLIAQPKGMHTNAGLPREIVRFDQDELEAVRNQPDKGLGG